MLEQLEGQSDGGSLARISPESGELADVRDGFFREADVPNLGSWICEVHCFRHVPIVAGLPRRARVKVEPVMGIGPTTFALGTRCSTTELHRLTFIDHVLQFLFLTPVRVLASRLGKLKAQHCATFSQTHCKLRFALGFGTATRPSPSWQADALPLSYTRRRAA